jgi:tartrate dehydrogenase/decarboxylase/D-malate dehydrogenase
MTAVETAIKTRHHLTRDMGGNASTQALGDEVARLVFAQ